MFFFEEPDYNKLLSYQELGEAGTIDVGSSMLDTFIYEDLSVSKTRNLDHEKMQDVMRAQSVAPELFLQGYEEPELLEGEGYAIDIINQTRKETYQAQTDRQLSDYEGIVEPNIEMLKKLDPEIRNINEIDQAIIDKAKALREKYEQTAARATPWDSFWGTLGGGVVGAMNDPLNVSTMAIGPGATSLAGGFLRGVSAAFGKSAAVGIGVESVIQPTVFDYKKEIESPYELRDALMNIAFAGIGEGILGGAGYSILRGFNKLSARGELTPAQQRVGDYIQQIQDIADNTDVYTARQLEAHVEALVRIDADLKEGRIPDFEQLNNRIEKVYLEDFGKEINGTQADIVELSAKRQELAQRFRSDVYELQSELKQKFEGRMRPDEVEDAQSLSSSAYIRNKPGISLDAVRGAQKADWEAGEAGTKLKAHDDAVQAHIGFKESRKANGDQVKLKERIDKMDAQLQEKTKYLDAAKKARQEYVKTQSEKARLAIPDAPTDSPKQKAFKKVVNRMLANMGASNIKVNVYEGDMPVLNASDDGVRFSLSEGGVSTRVPTAKSASENALEENLFVGLETDLSDPLTLKKNTDKISLYENYKPKSDNETPEEIALNLVEHIKNNLLWLHSLVPDDVRERSHMWYTGANRITETFAERYGYTNSQAAGVMAVLSPQKDWYMNASLGERVMEIYTNHQNTPWSPEMELVAADKQIVGSGKMKAPKGILIRNEKNKGIYNNIKGKNLSELSDDIESAAWIRVYDEAHHDRGHRVVTPEGDFVEFAKTKNGSKKVTGWGSFSEIAKAVSVLRDGSPENISTQMGAMHKVRNFYNNILLPDSPNGYVTIDTHAVAAGLIKPLAGNHLEVSHNFGTFAASSSKTGSKGTYGLYAEAYQQAADEVGILPRQMQSITWEAVRGFFSPTFKGKKANQEMINGIWQEYKDGKISVDEAREVIYEKAGGIEQPTWHRPDSDLANEQWLSSYKTELHRGSISRNYGLGDTSGGRARGDAAREPTSQVTNNNLRQSVSSDRAVEAAIDPETGELHLNIDAFENDEQLMRVLREEVIGHYGLRQTLGSKFDTVISDIKSAAYHNKELRQTWIDLSGVDPRTKQVINENAPYAGMADNVIADEIISKLAREELSFSETTLAKLMSFITKALRAVGLVKNPITMSEMQALVVRSERQLKRGAVQNNTPIRVTGFDSRNDEAADQPLEEIVESEANATVKGEDDGSEIIDTQGNRINYHESLKDSQRQLDAIDTLRICAL